jgi:hypothetical protein
MIKRKKWLPTKEWDQKEIMIINKNMTITRRYRSLTKKDN